MKKREIKFRAWDKIDKKLRYDIEILFSRNSIINNKFCVDFSGIDDAEETDLENINLMQYINLKDKNGKEIFEGDIVEVSHSAWHLNCEVKYFEQATCFGIESLDKIDKGVRKSFKNVIEEGLTVKVIGNIYENPELL